MGRGYMQKGHKSMKLFLSKNFYTDEKECAVLAVLNGLYSSKHERLITSVSLIGYIMTGKFLNASIQQERTILGGIRQGIRSLESRKIIEIIGNNKDDYIFSSKGLVVDAEKEHFTVIEQWEMQKIFEMTKKPFNVLNFFIELVGTINNQTKEWHMSQDKMVEFFGGSKRTINDYLKLLEEIKLIYVYRPRKRRVDGTYQNINNSYGRYADRDMIISSAAEYIDKIECEDILSKIDRRSIKLRYNAFCKGAKRYLNNPESIQKLYIECLKYNKSLKASHIEGGYGADKEWKMGEELDLSVFPENIDAYDEWGETDSLDKDYSIEEILEMPTINEVGVHVDANKNVKLIDIDSIFEEEHITQFRG